MSNYLTIPEALQLSGIPESEFYEKYIDGGIISVRVDAGQKTIELSEFFRVFPNARLALGEKQHHDPRVELEIKRLKIENLEYQVANLQRQLEKQNQEYEWLRTKFDNTTLLLEQKLDTSELDKYKQEIRQLSQQAMQWEKKYNTLLAANELKSLIKENRELKEQLMAKMPGQTTNTLPKETEAQQGSYKEESRQESQPTSQEIEILKKEIARLQAAIVTPSSFDQRFARPMPATAKQSSDTTSNSELTTKPKRRKIFGIF